jgi:hypothetical protein
VPTRSFLFLAAVLLLAPAGCGPDKLDQKKTYPVAPGETQMMLLPKQARPQRVTVEYESDQAVDVGIYKAEDVKEGENLPTSKALAVDRAKDKGSISADLGPDVATTVTISGLGKSASVKVHVHNRK